MGISQTGRSETRIIKPGSKFLKNCCGWWRIIRLTSFFNDTGQNKPWFLLGLPARFNHPHPGASDFATAHPQRSREILSVKTVSELSPWNWTNNPIWNHIYGHLWLKELETAVSSPSLRHHRSVVASVFGFLASPAWPKAGADPRAEPRAGPIPKIIHLFRWADP